jgi:hypothetical protein
MNTLNWVGDPANIDRYRFIPLLRVTQSPRPEAIVCQPFRPDCVLLTRTAHTACLCARLSTANILRGHLDLVLVGRLPLQPTGRRVVLIRVLSLA